MTHTQAHKVTGSKLSHIKYHSTNISMRMFVLYVRTLLSQRSDALESNFSPNFEHYFLLVAPFRGKTNSKVNEKLSLNCVLSESETKWFFLHWCLCLCMLEKGFSISSSMKVNVQIYGWAYIILDCVIY